MELGYDANFVNLQFKPNKLKSLAKSCVLPFISKDLFNESVRPVTPEFHPKDDLVHLSEMFDGFVVGSDQIWRRGYALGFMKSFFLEFTKDYPVRRVSYAASFGVSDWEFKPEETDRLAKLIANFHAVSVREDSGVKLCQEFLGVEAKHVLDPTMLLEQEKYLELVKEERSQNFEGDLLYYVLDMNEPKQSFIQSCAQALGMTPFCANTSMNSLGIQSYPWVTNWVKSFMAAKFVITDSFHGSVLSILFNRPFLALGHAGRGNARFISLLKMFNLEDRLVSHKEDINLEKINAPIDWKAVNEILSHQRKESQEFLRLAFE